MKKIILLAALLLSLQLAFGQNTTLVFDFERSTLDQDPLLPAEEYFTLTGAVAPTTQLVELSLLPESSRSNKILYQNSWIRSFSATQNTFVIPVNYRLESNQNYDLAIKYFRATNPAELQALYQALQSALTSYLSLKLEQNDEKLRLNGSPDDVLQDLNQLVKQSLAYYTNRTTGRFTQFSDLPLDYLKSLKGAELPKEEAVAQTVTLLMRELGTFLNNQSLILNDERYIDNYQTERISKPLTIHGGYGLTFFNNNVDNLETSSAVMAGLSFPFSRQRYNSAFLANTAIIVGALVSTMEDEAGRELEGPLFNVPLYAGFGYKALQLVRINAGAVVLEEEAGDRGVYVKPFVGLSIDLDIWAKISR